MGKMIFLGGSMESPSYALTEGKCGVPYAVKC